MSSLGPMEVLIILWVLAMLILPAWASVDAAHRPESAWAQAGQRRIVWLVLIAVGFLIPFIGLVLPIVYLSSIRPQLKRAEG